MHDYFIYLLNMLVHEISVLRAPIGFSQFGLKTGCYGSCGLASKPLSRVFLSGPQNWQLRFHDLAHKINAIVSWFGPQNHVGYDLLDVTQSRWEDEDSMGHAPRSTDLLRLEASWARVFQSSLKTGRGTARMVHMALSWRSRGYDAKDRQVDARAASVSSTPTLPFLLYWAIRVV
jgi:hypothetical protein